MAGQSKTRQRLDTWPALSVRDWSDTRDTLHMWAQIVGKIRMANAPMLNHWWQVPLYVTSRGLGTSSIPYGKSLFEMEFDFLADQLHIRTGSGAEQAIALEPKTVAKFYAEVMAALRALDLDVSILARPVEVSRAIPFAEDTEHASYNPDHARLFWGQLVAADRVMNLFRARFIGKSSPVHFFWGSPDLAATRFSGRSAPTHPGGAPNCGDWVMVEAYSHELASCGFWPGGFEEGTFYAYAYPEPAGYARSPVRPAEAFYSTEVNEFLLPYRAVRTAQDPEATLLDFLQTTYEAAADNGDWDRERLEDDPQRRAAPR